MKSSVLLLLLALLFTSCLKERTFLGGTPLKISPELSLKFVAETEGEVEGRGGKGEVGYLKIYSDQSEEEYKKLIANQSFYYEGLFKEYKTPYPGILSNTKGCPPELTGKALISEEGNHFYVWAYANKRRVVGECLKQLNHYYFQKFILRCPGHSETYQIELYLPFESYDHHDAFQVSCAI